MISLSLETSNYLFVNIFIQYIDNRFNGNETIERNNTDSDHGRANAGFVLGKILAGVRRASPGFAEVARMGSDARRHPDAS